jgi:hypothetical protein
VTIDLDYYLNKHVVATLRNGTSVEGFIVKGFGSGPEFPYSLNGVSYTRNGSILSEIKERPSDIVCIRFVFPSKERQPSSPLPQEVLEAFAKEASPWILSDVQNFQDWAPMLKLRIRDAVYRKLGALNEPTMQILVEEIFKQTSLTQ